MTSLPTNIPNLSDITSIVVGNLSCDGITGSVLKVIGFLTQLETLQKRLEGRASQEFKTDIKEAWQEFVNQFTDNTKKAWANATDGFEQWLASAEQGNILNGMNLPFGPQTFLESGNANDFAIFDYDSTVGNLLDPGGAHADGIPGIGCDAGMGFSLAQSATNSFSARIGDKLNIAGQVASFGAALVQKPLMLIEGMATTIANLHGIVSGNEQIFDFMLQNADDITAALSPLKADDYQVSSNVAEFSRLLSTAIRQLKQLERNMAVGGTASADARKAVKDATAWICQAGGDDPRAEATSLVVALLTMFQAQLDLFSSSNTKYFQLSVNISDYQSNLPAAAKFQPTFNSFFTKVRCGLEKIQTELGAITSQNTLKFQLKRMEWCATMTSYQTLLELYHPESFQTELKKEFTSALGTDVQGVGASLALAFDDVESATATVLFTANNFAQIVATKLRQFVDQSAVEKARTALKLAIDAYKLAIQPAKDEIATFLAKDDSQAAKKNADTFFKAAQGVAALAPIVAAMVDGEYDTMFTLDGLNSQLSEISAQVISKAVECCEEEGSGDARSRAGLAELREAQRKANADVRASSFDEHFGANVNANASLRVLFDLRALKQQYQQFKRLMEIPCLGGLPTSLPKLT